LNRKILRFVEWRFFLWHVFIYFYFFVSGCNFLSPRVL
jgi:hypothetical protein